MFVNKLLTNKVGCETMRVSDEDMAPAVTFVNKDDRSVGMKTGLESDCYLSGGGNRCSQRTLEDMGIAG